MRSAGGRTRRTRTAHSMAARPFRRPPSLVRQDEGARHRPEREGKAQESAGRDEHEERERDEGAGRRSREGRRVDRARAAARGTRTGSPSRRLKGRRARREGRRRARIAATPRGPTGAGTGRTIRTARRGTRGRTPARREGPSMRRAGPGDRSTRRRAIWSATPAPPKPSIACETISGTKCGQNRNDRRRMRTISFASVAAERKKTAGTILPSFAVSGQGGGRRRREGRSCA